MRSKNKVFQKIDLKNPNKAPEYISECTSKDVVSIHDLAQEVADISGVSKNDVHEIFDELSKTLGDLMADGSYDVLKFTTGTGLQMDVWPLTLTKIEKPN